MKLVSSVVLSVTMMMSLVIVPVHAGNDNNPNSEQLKRKIERLESVDLKSKSSTVEEMYRKMLLQAYDDYQSALEQEIADLRQLVSIAGENQKVGSDEAVSIIRKLTEERDLTSDKIKALRGDSEAKTVATATAESRSPQAVRVANPPANISTVRTSAPPVTPANFVAAPAAADPPADNVSATVDWETRTAGCPGKVTASTAATIRITHIND